MNNIVDLGADRYFIRSQSALTHVKNTKGPDSCRAFGVFVSFFIFSGKQIV